MFWPILFCAALLAVGPVFSQKKSTISAIAILPNQQSVLVASDQGLTLMRLDSSGKGKKIETKVEKISSIKLSPDGKRIAILGGVPAEEGAIEILSASDFKSVYQQTIFGDVITDGCWVDDQSIWLGSMTGKIAQLNLKKREIKKSASGHSRGILAVELMRDQTLLTASIDQSIRVHSKKSRVLNNHTRTVNDLAIRPTKEKNALEMVASCSDDGTVRFWQPKIGRMVRFARLQSIPTCIVWTADGSAIIAGCRDGELRWIDPTSTKVTKSKQITDDWIFCIDLDLKNGRFIVGTAAGVKPVPMK